MKIYTLILLSILCQTSHTQTRISVGQEFFRPGLTQVGIDHSKGMTNFGLWLGATIAGKDLDQSNRKYYGTISHRNSYQACIYAGINKDFDNITGIADISISYGSRSFEKYSVAADDKGNDLNSYGDLYHRTFFGVGAKLGFGVKIKSARVNLLYTPELDMLNKIPNNVPSTGQTDFLKFQQLRQQVSLSLLFTLK